MKKQVRFIRLTKPQAVAPSGSGMRLERASATRVGLRFPAPDELVGRRSFVVDA
jgi:hypothetical protein